MIIMTSQPWASVRRLIRRAPLTPPNWGRRVQP